MCVSLALVLGSCRVRAGQTSESPFLRFFEKRSGLISFVAPDGNVHVIDQAGRGNRALTHDAGSQEGTQVSYSALTWSPDGTEVAFTRLEAASGDITGASLYAAHARGSGILRLFSSDRIQPFYLCWSPDSKRISLLSQVKGVAELELGMCPAGAQEQYVTVDRGAPYYWDWLSDSSSIAVHVHGGSPEERLSLITLDPAPHRIDIPVQASIFQAPNVTPDGKSVIYVRGEDGRFTLRLLAFDASTERTVASDSGVPYFSLSRDGTRLAYLAALSVQPVPQGIFNIVSVDGSTPAIRLTEAPVLAFFWAPDGRKLALILPDTSASSDPMFQHSDVQVNLKLVGCDAVTGKTWVIARFPSARGLLSILPFFDQYQRSSTIWSPDSRYVVFTAFSQKGVPAVYVARADGSLRPRFLTPGDFAYWSGR